MSVLHRKVMSFQRRVIALKREFMVRNKPTHLGIVTEYWDRSRLIIVN